MGTAESLPNKRLKLAGGDRLRKRSVVPLAGHGLRPTPLRRRAGRPQLKRDPLGGALPPHKHPFVNSLVRSVRGAPRANALEGGSVRRAPHPTAALREAAPRTSFNEVAAQRQVLNPKWGAASEPRAARSSIGAKH